MKKIKMTADTLLDIIQSVFCAADFPIEDGTSEWNGKTVTEVLNIEYYTFKHRIRSASDYLESMEKSLDKGYGLIELSSAERLYSKDIDHLTIAGNITLWLQSSKIKLLEDFIEECNLGLLNEPNYGKFPLVIDGEARIATIFFSEPVVTSISPQSEIGEAMICEVATSMVITPDITTYADYYIEIAEETIGNLEFCHIPISAISMVKNMTSKPVPYMASPKSTGFINLSGVKAFNLTFYGFNLPIINSFANTILDDKEESSFNNNKKYLLRISRRGEQHTFGVIVSDLKNNIENGTGYEVFTVSFSIGGKQ